MSALPRLAGVLAVALALRLANLWVLASLPVADYQAGWTESDMGVNFAWSSQILRGDLLGRPPPHPFTEWMQEIAPRDTWERWWGGAEVYQQAPLYPYLLAGMRGLVGDGFRGLAACQLLLGLASVALIFLVADLVFDRTVATVAGLVAALYGPFAFHEALFLRDTLAVTTSLAMLWALLRCDARPARWGVAGLLFAVALLTRETALLFAPIVLGWIASRFRHAPRTAARAAAAWTLGVALGLTPLVARNVAVGAPPLSWSNRAVEGFIYGHAADGSPTDLLVPDSAPEILRGADGSLPAAIRLTLATHESWIALVRYELAKVAALVASYEAADNASWYYFLDRSPPLRASLHFPAVLGLGLVGLWVGHRRAPGECLLRWFLIATAAGLVYATLLARYRLVAVAGLIPYAAAAAVWIARRLRAGRVRGALAAAAAALLLAGASMALYAETRARRGYRPTEFTMAAGVHFERGAPEAALAELRDGIAKAPRIPGRRALPGGFYQLPLAIARVGVEADRPGEAVALLTAAAEEFPDDANLQQLIGLLYRDALGAPERAAAHLAAAERLRASAGAAP